MKKIYSVTMRYTVHATVDIEADDEDQAKSEAHQELSFGNGHLIDWETISVKEV